MPATGQSVFIRFLFIGEGPFDEHLVPHLRRCCVFAGAAEAEGVTIPWSRIGDRIGRSVAAKVEFGLGSEPSVNLLFIHRDADSQDPEPRHEEIREAVETASSTVPYVAVVPVQETEAWLLLDESEIRLVAENPRGTVTLGIPARGRVESVANPKELLNTAILDASELSGRRYRRMKGKMAQKCAQMLDALDPEGPVCNVPSWSRMYSDLKAAIDAMTSMPPP